MHFEQSIILAASRETVWKLVADTDRLNREVGLPPILFTFTPRKAGGTDAIATARIAGFTLRYREHPFDWVRPAYYHVRRTFEKGPVREMVGGARLEEVEGGTLVTVWGDLEPTNALGAIACRAIGAKAISDFILAYRGFDAYLKEAAATPYPRHSGRPTAHRERLRQKLALLKTAGASEDVAERLGGYLAGAPPESTVGMRPFALADRWGVDRISVLKACLLAAGSAVGLLDLRWRVLCPSCRGGPAATSRLSEVGESVHCEACNIRFDAEFDRSVEVCFSVAPAIRDVRETTFCIGGPGRAPHAVAQFYLRPGERRTETLILAPGGYTLASLQAAQTVSYSTCESAADEACVRITESESRAVIQLESGEETGCRSAWTIVNESGQEVVLRMETPEWTNQTATAALVTSLQTFRDQFSSEVLAPGMELAVRQICVLFSDLKGSTAMYRAQGDAPSYRTVREHFDLMRRIIDAHNGAIVKTIGDAVMATFSDPAEGVDAALAIQRAAMAEPDHPVVKLGLHYGPAIAVTANEKLDYFGQTVNLAARVQGASEGGDVVISSALAADPAIAEILSSGEYSITPFETVVRGVDEPVKMLRIFFAGASKTQS